MNDGQAGLAARLKRMRWTATGLVAAMAALFVAASEMPAVWIGVDLLRAFSEAALIGGLADWFAVAALFKRPLGLPIPHTAIVPTRKDEIGRSLARFVADNFFVRDAVSRRLARVDLAERLALWLGDGTNRRLVTRDLCTALDWLVRGVDSKALRSAAGKTLRDALEHISVHRAAATAMDVLASGGHGQALMDHLVQLGRDQLDDNKDAIRRRIRERSPWWLPRFVDEQLYDQLVGELERILEEVGADPAHPARIQFNERLRMLAARLEDDPDLIRKTADFRDELLGHPAIRRFAAQLAERGRDFLHASFEDPDSALRRGIERELAAAAETLRRDAALRAQLNRWLENLLTYIVEQYREQLSQVISETVEHWDPSATARRVELHVGSDLQFIRINGTLVGGCVGVVLYFLWHVLSL